MPTLSKPLTPIQYAVLEQLENNGRGLTRAELQQKLFGVKDNLNFDRRIRQAIEELRNRGFVIVSNSEGRGYRLTTDPAEVRHYYNEQIKRARTLLRTAYKVKTAHGLKDQMSLGG